MNILITLPTSPLNPLSTREGAIGDNNKKKQMSLNANYIFEDLGEIKCSIIEKNCKIERVEFLKKLLEFNGFTVVVVKSPPPKTTAKPAATVTVETPVVTAPPPPETFTVGVTDLTFDPITAVYNRHLKTPDGHTVTVRYWKQQETVSHDDVWYWKKQ